MSDDRSEKAPSFLPDYAIWTAQLVAAGFGAPELSVLLGGTAAMGLARVRALRMQDFGRGVRVALDDLKSDLDELRDRLAADEARAELLEHGAEAAARTSSEDRRRYLAALVAKGITTEERTADEAKKLLYLLRDLTDAEVIWLIHLSHEHVLGGRTDHYTRHEEILRPASMEIGIAQSERDRAALQDGYMRNLERAGLIDRGAIGGMGAISVTDLGKMLLRYIGVDVSKGLVR